jgi:hypothetical protein
VAQRNAFKSNGSFFRMLAVGAVGARAVQAELNSVGHDLVELERGSLSTRVWRDVKRKRVRIPDLCCTRCGVRVESRAKTKPELAMSHSPREAERAWDYGMLDADWIAFPILLADERTWSAGLLREPRSLWREHTLTSWTRVGHINVFAVSGFRSATPQQKKPKGVSEGSEVQVSWKARFAAEAGEVTATSGGRLDYVMGSERRAGHFRLGATERGFVGPDGTFVKNQVVAGQVRPLALAELQCRGDCGETEVGRMLRSRERTVRFAGCKLARRRSHSELASTIRELASDPEEDPYVQMEARSYLCELAGASANEQFRDILLAHTDHQMRLEAAVALAETRTPSSLALLREVLEDRGQPLFLRSACAWAVGCHGTAPAAESLVQAFADVAPEIREEALLSLAELGTVGVGPLMDGLGASNDIAAGSAEALRLIRQVPIEELLNLARTSTSTWPVWTLANLPRELVTPHIASLQSTRPDVHYAITVLWTFLESWIAEHWTPGASP